MKSGGGIHESKEHNSGLEESSVCLECGFPLVAILYLDIVVSSLYVKLGEPLLSNKLTNKLFNERKGIGVSYSVLIEPAIILYQSLLAIFLFDKEER